MTKAELSREARIPLLRENPTLKQWIEGIADYHISFHIGHMKEIRQASGPEPA